MYDWANSGYSTISITVLLYYMQEIVWPKKTGEVVWAWGIGLSMLVAALLSPVLGALADANCSKRKWLAFTAFSGASLAVLLACVPPEFAYLVTALFVLTCLMFELSLGFYNGFLPELADEKSMNRISAWGYGLGYLGGASALVVAILINQFGDRIGLPDLSDRLRAGILVMGLWWGLFTLPVIWVLRDRGRPPRRREPLRQATAAALREVRRTLGRIRLFPMLALFLLGFLVYNDGIQTVISQSGTFAKSEPLNFSVGDLGLVILVVQLIAFPGAVLVGRLSDRIGQKSMLNICLAVWVGLLVAAWFVTTQLQFWILAMALALVMGGTQSVSRAIMGMMTPPNRTAEFFGFFNFSGKATSFLGPVLFGLIIYFGGTPRQAILSLLFFFLVGWAIVARIDVHEGRRQALQEETH